MNKPASIPDGVYVLFPDGASRTVAEIVGGKVVSQTEESNFATHIAAQDDWADIVDNIELEQIGADMQQPIAAMIATLVFGADVQPEAVVVAPVRSEHHG